MPELKYKVGDEFYIKLTITDLDSSDDDDSYLITGAGDSLEAWVNEETLDEARAGNDEPIGPGVMVRPRNGAGVPGKVIALRKGMAWVDWNPTSEDDTSVSSRPVNLLVRLTEAEVRQLVGV